MQTNAADLLPELIQLIYQTGEAIMAIYADETLWQTQQKTNDTPVTAADLAAQSVLLDGLNRLSPEIPILSEEGHLVPWELRRHWQTYWLLDPLDGTREFLQRNGEFTVNIALIQHGKPIMGLVYAPATQTLYWGGEGLGAWKQLSPLDQARSIQVRQPSKNARLLTSRRHSQHETLVLEELVTQGIFNYIEGFSLGSSLKFCQIAEGSADLYLRLAPTSEWDTAAAQAILEAAGGAILVLPEGRAMQYNQKPDVTNPSFIALALPVPDWIYQLKISA